MTDTAVVIDMDHFKKISESKSTMDLDALRTALGQRTVTLTRPGTYRLVFEPTWATAAEGVGPYDGINVVATNEQASYRLTVTSLEAIAKACKISKPLLYDTPTNLLAPVINYWLSTVEIDHGPQFAVASDDPDTALAVVRPSALLALSDTSLLDTVHKAMSKALGDAQINVAPLVANEVDHVSYALTAQQTSTKLEGAPWTYGIRLSYSRVGSTSPVLSPYLAGAPDHLPKPIGITGPGLKYSTAKHGKDETAVMVWVDESVGMLMADADTEVAKFEDLIEIDVSQDLDGIVPDLLALSKLPAGLKKSVIDAVEHVEGDTAYDLAESIAAITCEPGLTWDQVERVMAATGRIYEALGNRCPRCHSLSHHEH